MSKQIDQKVVEMRFDNKHFETNVRTTMSSLDKLKQSLQFKDAEKGFKNLDKSAKEVNMTHLAKALDETKAKFSALEVVGVTALANITNSAVNAGKNLVKSLSIDQITAGMSKYEQKTASVQTIMNATGKSIDEVNKYLEKLMWFSDETSYGFTDMTAALGQMTSSGGDIENLIPLITGVANATAYAGKGASEFSRVMYNLNQSYGAGYLQLMDWKSVELAGVGSKQLKQTFIDTAVAMGKIKEGQVTIANFSETLKDKWADTAVMEAAFGKFGDFTEKVYKLSEDIESGNLSGYSDEIRKLAEEGKLETTADMMEALSKEYEGVGKQAFKSAQEAKSFTEAIDATKDAVSSGWMQTFELIFGNYEQAKVLWTELCNNLWDIFASGGESRNALLKKALSYSPLSQFSEKLKQVTDTIQAPVKKLQEYEDIVNRIINGEFGNGQARWDKLTAAGYDWAHAQNLVNEKLGDSTRHATNFTEELAKQTKQTVELTDAKLKELGFTKEEIKMYRELEAESKKTGKSIDELIASMEEADGRTLLIGGFKNIGSGLVGAINAVKEAFSEIFPPMSALQLYNLIKKFNELTESLRLTDKKTGELNSTGNKLKRTFKGVFAIFDIILTIVGGPLKLALKVVSKILGKFGMGVLDVTANVGDAIVAFRDWLDSIIDYEKIFSYLTKLYKPAAKKVKEWVDSFKELPVIRDSIEQIKNAFKGDFSAGPVTTAFSALWKIIVAVAKGIKSCYDAFMSLPAVQKIVSKLADVFGSLFGGIGKALGNINLESIVNGINRMFETLSKWISSFGDDSGKNGEHLMSGLGNAISGATKGVVGAIISICEAIYNAFTTFFGIHSPSKVFFTLGKFCIAGLVAGLLFAKDDTKAAMGELGASMISGAQTTIDTIVNIIKDLDLGTILAATGIFGIYKLATKTLDTIELFGKGVEGFGSMCKSAGGVLDAVKERINPKKTKFEQIADSVLKLAGSIAILAGAVYILSKIPKEDLWNGVKAIAALAGICVVLALAAKLLKGADGSFAKLAGGLILMSVAIAILAIAMSKLTKSMGEMDEGTLDQAAEYIVGFGAFVIALAAISKFGKGTGKGLLGMLLGVSVALLVMAKVTKTLGTMEANELNQAKWYLVGFGVILLTLVGLSKLAGGTTVAGLGALFAGLAATLIAMSICIKTLGGLDEDTLIQGMAVVGAFSIFLMGLIAITGVLCNSAEIAGMAGLFFGVSMALLSMAACIRILGGMEPDALKQGMNCVGQFVLMIALLMAVSMFGSGAKGLAATLLAISVALAVMAGLVVVLGVIPESVLNRGLTVVVGVGLILATLVAVSKLAEKSAGAIWGITAMLAVVTASMLILSKIDANKLTSAVDALSIVMLMVSIAIGVSKLAEKSMGSIIAMSALIAVLGGVMYLLAGLPAGQVLASAGALSLVLAVMAGVFVVLGTFGSMLGTAMMGVVGLLALCVPLLAVVGILHLMNGLDNVMGNVGALTILLVAMTAMLLALSVVGALIVPALAGVVGLLALCVPLLAFVGILYLMEGLENAMANVGVLTLMLGALGGLMVLLAKFGPMATIGVTALYALVGLITVIGVLAVAIGVLMEKFPVLEQFVDKGISVLEKLAYGIGSVIGNIIKGFANAVTENLPEIGMKLGMFMTNAMPFILGAKMVDENVSKGVKALAAAVLTLTGADILAGIGSFFGASSGFASFGTELSMFMTNAMPFILGISSVSAESLQAVKYLAEAIMILTKADILDGLTSWLTGGVDFGEFGSSIGDLGTGLATFSESLSGFSEEDMEVVRLACESIKILAEAAKEIPNDGGWAGKIFGENGLGKFSEQIPKVGTSLSSFVTNIGTFGDKEAEKVKYACDAIKSFAEAGKSIEGKGGWADAIFGDDSLGAFGEDIKSVGSSLSEFVDSVSNMDDDGYKHVINAIDVINAFSNINVNLSSDGKNLKTFATNVKKIGGEMNGLWKEIGQFGGGTKERADAVCYVLNKFAGVADKVGGKNGGTLKTFAVNVKKIGGEMKGLWDSIGQFGGGTKERADAVCYVLNKFAGVADKVGSKTGDTLYTFAGNVKATGEKMKDLWAAIGQFGGGTKERAKAVCEVLDMFSNSAKNCTSDGSNLSKVVDAVNNTIDGVLSITSSAVKSFENAGKNLVEGFARGIFLNRHISSMAARKMANDAEEAARNALDEHSPSRVFEGIGKFAVMGLANGLNKVKMATDAGRDLGNAVLEATQDELGIHSPSIVFDKKVGRYIVQGIAEGIEKDMSAEEAAKKKAQNIVDAFKSEFDKFDAKVSFNDATAELAKSKLGAYPDAIKEADITRSLLPENLKVYKDAAKMAEDKWIFAKGQYEKGEILLADYLAIQNDYIAKQQMVTDTENAINKGEFDYIQLLHERRSAAVEQRKEQRALNREEYLSLYGKDLTKDQLSEYMRKSLEEDLIDDELQAEYDRWNHANHLDLATAMYGNWDNFPEEVKNTISNLWEIAKKSEAQVRATKSEIAEYLLGDEIRDAEEIEKQKEKRRSRHDHYMELYEDTLTPEEIDEINKGLYNDLIAFNDAQIKEEEEVLAKLIEDYGEHSDEVEEQRDKIQELYDENDLNIKAIRDIIEDAKDREREEAKERNRLASSQVDAEYSLWVATAGRDATSAEKNVAKLASLSKQVTIQSSALQIAYKEWQEAANEYGRSSNEAQSKYNDYLNEQLKLANLQNDILDIEEKTNTRQKAAAAEYKDYVEKYAKYYELNGMSKEDLERDAKLVSGYDANKSVDKMLSSTKDALNNISKNSDYVAVTEGFKKLGTSYVDATSTGVIDQSNVLITEWMNLSAECLRTLNEDIESWKEVGKQCVEGFVSGISDNIYLAAQEAARMAQEAIIAAKAEFDIHSPSRAFADIGMYAAMGLAKGLTDNSYLSNMAASELGSRAIDNLRNSISRITDIVNSEVDTQPTIRPVLDLSDVKSKTKTLNAMFSAEQAMTISASMNDNRMNESQNGNVDAKSGNKYEFNQYNYSPKALSRADIYRQTKNQFAAMKGELT